MSLRDKIHESDCKVQCEPLFKLFQSKTFLCVLCYDSKGCIYSLNQNVKALSQRQRKTQTLKMNLLQHLPSMFQYEHGIFLQAIYHRLV